MSFSVRQINEDKPRKKWPWDKVLVGALTVCRPLLGLYGDWKKRKEEEAKRKLLLKRTLLILVAVLFAFSVLAGLAKMMTGVSILGVDTFVSITGAELQKDEHGFTNLLLLGQGDADHDGKDLTDTIMIASIDPDTQSIVLLSFPRDLYFLHTENMGKGRLNTLYRDYKGYLRFQKGMEESDASIEAIKELSKEMGRVVNLEIHHALKVNFTAVIDAVNALDGIEVDVPYDIVDTEYPDNNYGYETFEIAQGLQTIDGETALKYARSRHTTSDFDRSARQQQIIAAMAAKAQGEGILKNPGTITKLVSALLKNIETTLSMREIIGLAEMGKDLDRSRIVTMQLSDRNALYGTLVEPGGFLYAPPRNLFQGASVLLPVSIPEFPVTWRQIQTLSELLIKQRKVHIENPVINVLNAGGPPGSARKLATDLIRYGYTVDEIANASIDKQDQSFILPRTEENAALTTFFSTLLDIPTNPPYTLAPDEMGQITIVLGRDYRYAPLQEAFPVTE